MATDRFHDEGTYLHELAGVVDVRCPSCAGHAVVRVRSDDVPARVTCDHCGYTADE